MKFYSLIISIFFIYSCGSGYECPPSTTTNLIIKPIVKNYFPYKQGDTIRFTKFIDSINVGIIEFVIDTSSRSISNTKYNDCGSGSMYSDKTITDHFIYQLTNRTEIGKNWSVEITGNYAKNFYTNDDDLTDLNINLTGQDFVFYYFGKALKYGNGWKVDSININNKNYGQGFCINYGNPTYVYFNSEYGIVSYVNLKNREQYIIAE